jgi:hypothetical protein
MDETLSDYTTVPKERQKYKQENLNQKRKRLNQKCHLLQKQWKVLKGLKSK